VKKATISDLTPAGVKQPTISVPDPARREKSNGFRPDPGVVRRLARLRVPLGFAFAVAVFLLARPTRDSLLWGALVAAAGEGVRFWAAGHLEKGREVTSSGPYRWTRHPLYVGSTIIGLGLALACANWIVALIITSYLAVTLVAAMRTEERELRAKFGDAYDVYCGGATVARAFSAGRALRNREHRAVGGVALGLLLLAAKTMAW
jgi:phospholipid methyltransferase